MSDFIIRFVVAGLLFAVVDAVWLTFVANKVYKQELGKILAKKPRLKPAVLFYVMYLVGLVVFVLNPAFEAGEFSYALGLGALFGLVCYATYDLTNRSTLKDFTLKITIIDIAWGTILTGLVSTLAFLILHR